MDRITWLVGDAFGALPALLAMLPVYLVGVACSWLAGVRGRLLPLVMAVPLLIGGSALIGEVASVASLAMSSRKLLLGLVLLCGAMFVGRRLRGRGRSDAPAGDAADEREPVPWVVFGGFGGALLGVGVWLAGIGGADTPPQGNDDIFHGFLVARMADLTDFGTDAISPVSATATQPVSYYPYGVHLLMSIGERLTPAGVPAAMNGTWVLMLGFLLPVATAAAARDLFPRRPVRHCGPAWQRR